MNMSFHHYHYFHNFFPKKSNCPDSESPFVLDYPLVTTKLAQLSPLTHHPNFSTKATATCGLEQPSFPTSQPKLPPPAAESSHRQQIVFLKMKRRN